MIRTPPQHNTTHPPGQVVYDRPLVQAMAEYTSEMRQKALRDAFDEGWKVGYVQGLADSRRAQQQTPDPYGEAGR